VTFDLGVWCCPEQQRIYAEEKRKKLGEEMRANEARRHNDFFT